ncbi:MAG: transglutaminase family protein [Anaeromyxobacter sp.]|nr:transglutaminase family protein [Anaeromyxobacter sp.]
MDETLLAELADQDAVVRARGLEIWVGAEPTFTDRRSQEAWWLADAEGGDKLERAQALLLALAPRLSPGARLLRLQGRQFPGEAAPRFALGALFRRDQPAVARRDFGGGAGQLGGSVPTLDGEPLPVPALAPGEALLTVTPDPAVVEVNTAPAKDLRTFHRDAEAIYAAAEEAGLSPVRFRYNGRASDSGGGGQLTLGGPTPDESPFLRHPRLLPRLVRYLSNHPSLSYAFAGDCVGSASQGPRPDEGVRERWEELQVAVDRLEARGGHVTPQELWESLAPLLVDASGNSHRSELNIEKLWNPWLPGRGKLGLVELRSLRMPASARRLTAVAALFRGLAARLCAAPYDEPLADWGGALHDQLALPTFMEQDLRLVLADLAACGLGLGPALSGLLLERPEPLGELRLGAATLTVTPAAEFWPLLGDVASQERASARLVDASCERVEVAVSHPQGQGPGRLGAAGWEVPLHATAGGRRHVAALRFRAYAPRPGLHPGLPALDPLVLTWEREGHRHSVELHGWLPGGGSYPGLPADAAEARRRRRERVRVGQPGPLSLLWPPAISGVTLDLRRLDVLRTTAARAKEGASP